MSSIMSTLPEPEFPVQSFPTIHHYPAWPVPAEPAVLGDPAEPWLDVPPIELDVLLLPHPNHW